MPLYCTYIFFVVIFLRYNKDNWYYILPQPRWYIVGREEYLLGLTYSVTTFPVISGGIVLDNFKITMYGQDSHYFVVSVCGRSGTYTVIKLEVFVSTGLSRINYLC